MLLTLLARELSGRSRGGWHGKTGTEYCNYSYFQEGKDNIRVSESPGVVLPQPSSVPPRAPICPGDSRRAGIRRTAGSAPSPDSAAGVRVSPRQAACAEASDAVGQRRPRAAPARPDSVTRSEATAPPPAAGERGLPGRRSLKPPRGPAAHTAAHPRPPRAPPARSHSRSS